MQQQPKHARSMRQNLIGPLCVISIALTTFNCHQTAMASILLKMSLISNGKHWQLQWNTIFVVTWYFIQCIAISYIKRIYTKFFTCMIWSSFGRCFSSHFVVVVHPSRRWVRITINVYVVMNKHAHRCDPAHFELIEIHRIRVWMNVDTNNSNNNNNMSSAEKTSIVQWLFSDDNDNGKYLLMQFGNYSIWARGYFFSRLFLIASYLSLVSSLYVDASMASQLLSIGYGLVCV